MTAMDLGPTVLARIQWRARFAQRVRARAVRCYPYPGGRRLTM
ncbi:hypothetical protein OG762_46235 [Streptomyces sp. NBC_01136]|nr:hypothetical protein OG762_00390 [Streptomyces sp. NBC_01136]WST81181.1 hypothetical protein OG762_46235 [Streptomyces sp. NBC_01136]